jgi:hypothetical protein
MNKIYIDGEGNAKALHFSFLDRVKNKLGKVKITRASEVEFDNNIQKWVAKIYQNGASFYSSNREDVLEMEKKEINHLLRKR